MLKLLIHTQNTILTSATLLDVFQITTTPVQTGIDQKAYAALQAELGGQQIPESKFFRRCGIFTTTTVVLTTQGQRHILPPAAQLIDPPDNLLDVLQNATNGKYQVINDAIIPNPDWQEPTFYIEPLTTDKEDNGNGNGQSISNGKPLGPKPTKAPTPPKKKR